MYERYNKCVLRIFIVQLVGIINKVFGNVRKEEMEYCKMIYYPYQQMHNIYIYIYIPTIFYMTLSSATWLNESTSSSVSIILLS
jgi:hypothetical protein